jgi:hypothetical protein
MCVKSVYCKSERDAGKGVERYAIIEQATLGRNGEISRQNPKPQYEGLVEGLTPAFS